MISGPDIDFECDGCGDEETVGMDHRPSAVLHIKQLLGWGHTGDGTREEDRHYCAACIAHLKGRKSDEELEDYDLTLEDAKQLGV